MLRRRVRGLVRLHLKNDPRSVEGILLGVVEGHYRLAKAKILVDNNRANDIPVDGEDYWPTENVLHVQRLG